MRDQQKAGEAAELRALKEQLEAQAKAKDALATELELLRRTLTEKTVQTHTRRKSSLSATAVDAAGLSAAVGGPSASTPRAHGIHMLLTFDATEDDVKNSATAVWLTLLSLLVTMTQCVVLCIITFESSHPRC